MVKRQERVLGGALDGVIALCLVILTSVSDRRFFAVAGHAYSSSVRAIDAIFAFVFVLTWRYCFSVLKLHNKSATIPSRLIAILNGVVLMTAPAIVFFAVVHHRPVTLGWVGSVLAALFCYEIARVAINTSLLDAIAARDPRRAIIIGSGPRASKAWRSVRTRYHSSIKLLGFVDDRDREDMPPDVERRYLGRVDDLGDLLLREVVDMVLIAMPIQSCYPLMQRAVHVADSAGVQVIYLEDIYSSHKRWADPNETIFRELAPQQDHYLTLLAAKRLLDIAGSLVGMILLSPLFLLVAFGVKLTSRGPVFYAQERYGHRRRRFKMFKFRSMVQDAEALLPTLEQDNEATGPIFKMKHDPRVTSFGKFIRGTSLDELPQLWNVLLGDMSLVGPRPMSVRDVSLFSAAALVRRFSVKPGMTGLWQVNGRSLVGFDEWMALDNRYIDRWSLLLDLKILARTVGAVFRRSGAM